MTAPTRATGAAAPSSNTVVVDSAGQTDRIDDHRTGGGERAVPYHCPFCAEEDLRPHGTTHGAWHCRTCLRAFSVRFLGLAAHEPWDDAPAPPAGLAPTRPANGPSRTATSPPPPAPNLGGPR
jgi:hypothetical protein